MSKFCSTCGNPLEEGGTFCSACGTKVPMKTEQAEETTNIYPNQPMNQIGATTSTSTAQPPAIPSSLANDGDRIIAFIIDGIIWGIVMSIVFSPIRGFQMMDFGDITEIRTNVGWNYLQMALSFLYFWLMETITKGQTLGKMLMKLRTVDQETFQPVSSGRYALHAIGKAFFLILDLIIGLFVKDSRSPIGKSQIRATQRISKTVVIKLP